MQEEVIAKVCEWIQAMGRGEKITDVEGEGYLYYIKRERTKIKVFYAHGRWKHESSMTLNDMLYYAQQQIEKEEKDAAKTRLGIAH